jgi:hypothetical protein
MSIAIDQTFYLSTKLVDNISNRIVAKLFRNFIDTGLARALVGRSEPSVPPRERDFFSSPERLDRLWGLSGLCSTGTAFPSWVVQRPGFEVDHSLSPSADFKNKWSHTSPPSILINGVDKKNFNL